MNIRKQIVSMERELDGLRKDLHHVKDMTDGISNRLVKFIFQKRYERIAEKCYKLTCDLERIRILSE